MRVRFSSALTSRGKLGGSRKSMRGIVNILHRLHLLGLPPTRTEAREAYIIDASSEVTIDQAI